MNNMNKVVYLGVTALRKLLILSSRRIFSFSSWFNSIGVYWVETFLWQFLWKWHKTLQRWNNFKTTRKQTYSSWASQVRSKQLLKLMRVPPPAKLWCAQICYRTSVFVHCGPAALDQPVCCSFAASPWCWISCPHRRGTPGRWSRCWKMRAAIQTTPAF